jgi:hypothetical protein
MKSRPCRVRLADNSPASMELPVAAAALAEATA